MKAVCKITLLFCLHWAITTAAGPILGQTLEGFDGYVEGLTNGHDYSIVPTGTINALDITPRIDGDQKYFNRQYSVCDRQL